MRLHITAAQLRTAILDGSPGPLELQLWQLITNLKDQTAAASIFVRLDFDGTAGGVVLECARPNWLGRFCWWLSPRRLWMGIA